MEEGDRKKWIQSFADLDVYQRLYRLSLRVIKDLLPLIPSEERFDLKDQVRRSCKAGPALIAEGFAKKHQKRSWKKYIDDAIGEVNETIHHISICKEAYNINNSLCSELINEYNIANKQLYRLGQVWKCFHEE